MKVVNRIKKSEDFSITINKGFSKRLPSYLVFYKKTDVGHMRIGISASKKLGCAVVRSRAKRQVRAICDEIFDYSSCSIDVVIIIKNKFLGNDFNDNKSQLSDFAKGL